MISSGSWISGITRVLHIVFYAAVAIALPAVTILALYVGFGENFVQGNMSSINIWDATKIIISKPSQFLFSPKSLTTDERNVLFSYGNALILFISIFSVVFSSFSVFSKLNEVSSIVPFDSFVPRKARLFSLLSFFSQYHRTSSWYFRQRNVLIKEFAGRIMLQYYQNAETIIVVSGDYSWLFDTKWSGQLRKIVIAKLGNKQGEKITLLSYKSAAEVITEWKKHNSCRSDEKKIFENIVFNCKIKDHQSSIIGNGTNFSYIHLYKNVRRAKIHESICVFYSDREAGDLIRLANEQMRAEYNNKKESNKSEKDEILNSSFS